MAKDDISPVRGVSIDASIHRAQKAHAKQAMGKMVASQVDSTVAFDTWADQALFSPTRMRKKFEKLEERLRSPAHQKGEVQKGEKEAGLKASVVEQVAQNYQKQNPELQAKTLMLLSGRITKDDDADTILRKLEEFYTDRSLADEAVDFLIETSSKNKEMQSRLAQAKEQFNAAYGKEIRAGRNIAEYVRTFSKMGLGSPTALRDLYRDLIFTPRSPHQIFDELTEKFKFSDMKNIIDFILHSMGTDLRAKGSSISKAELHRILTEARTMQSILGVFRFFFARMNMIKGQFDRSDLMMPSHIDFEALARLLMKLLQERYPSPDKILKLSSVLGVSEEVAAQIIIFTQYRDALRHISPKLFKSERHRQDLMLTIMETLNDLEEEAEEEEEE